MEAASGVPWIPTSSTERPIQRVPSGLPGPGGIGVRRAAHRPLGGNHHGSRTFDTICRGPTGVGWAAEAVSYVEDTGNFGCGAQIERLQALAQDANGPEVRV